MDLTIDNDGYEAPYYRRSSFPVIEYHMLDKQKYYPLVALSGVAVRSVVYPLTLIKTRMQVQKSKVLYNGTFEAINQIIKYEGVQGLYSGFLIHNCSMLSQIIFLSTYEKIRHILAEKHSFKSNQQRSFIAGGLACAIAQTVVVPIDIITQHLQTKSVYKELHSSKGKSCANGNQVKLIDFFAFSVYHLFVLMKGFYKGFILSVITYSPTSAVWWLTYDTFSDFLSKSTPVWFPRLVIQCLAAPLSAVTTTIATTPVDAIRTRIQVCCSICIHNLSNIFRKHNWEGLRINK
ncbi:hypothetical protein HELRODRAFT_90491 [Helobdella robusta]|uniref:Solute carrier family 25 member 44 n=1 Tax=Helobdella robusta TaxID=6412 RepID=T1G7S1_HELRO|nr:hypothetical protein HELRODRAFT_90491 [Helobdella robusta]ESN91049.1 hypothetical protein HELRODRAFT_90491 [Helobdella robusta]